ncbi:hypothetical protein [Aeribacillus pallidus]|jgi:hypothetical protein|uniref:hypothetical protein n=1 Tax=Aeribacillus pallidus TaxID=33936 RepID=UPI001D58C2B5|nr:hypothetical protein [Bacillus sp. (in: firmicutes)]
MKPFVQMFLQYEVHESFIPQYEQLMYDVAHHLENYEAANIRWEWTSDHLKQMTEWFIVPTESHYFALKKLRTSRHHAVFGLLDRYVHGGVRCIQCYGVKRFRT